MDRSIEWREQGLELCSKLFFFYKYSLFLQAHFSADGSLEKVNFKDQFLIFDPFCRCCASHCQQQTVGPEDTKDYGFRQGNTGINIKADFILHWCLRELFF